MIQRIFGNDEASCCLTRIGFSLRHNVQQNPHQEPKILQTWKWSSYFASFMCFVGGGGRRLESDGIKSGMDRPNYPDLDEHERDN